MTAPTVSVGDGAFGFWAAPGDVFPSAVEQRCWVRKIASGFSMLFPNGCTAGESSGP